MPSLRIPTPLRSYTNGLTEVIVQGATVAAAMEHFMAQYPALRQHLYNKDSQLRPFVNLFVNGENIKDLQGLETSLKEGDSLILVPSIAGG